jgi:hypothetical protein
MRHDLFITDIFFFPLEAFFSLDCSVSWKYFQLTTSWKFRGGLGPKSLRGNSIYKSYRDMLEKATHHFKKASIPLKMYLKSLAILEKVFKNN